MAATQQLEALTTRLCGLRSELENVGTPHAADLAMKPQRPPPCSLPPVNGAWCRTAVGMAPSGHVLEQAMSEFNRRWGSQSTFDEQTNADRKLAAAACAVTYTRLVSLQEANALRNDAHPDFPDDAVLLDHILDDGVRLELAGIRRHAQYYLQKHGGGCSSDVLSSKQWDEDGRGWVNPPAVVDTIRAQASALAALDDEITRAKADGTQQQQLASALEHVHLLRDQHRPAPGCGNCETMTQLFSTLSQESAAHTAVYWGQVSQDRAHDLVDIATTQVTAVVAVLARDLMATEIRRDRDIYRLRRAELDHKVSALNKALAAEARVEIADGIADTLSRGVYAWNRYDEAESRHVQLLTQWAAGWQERVEQRRSTLYRSIQQVEDDIGVHTDMVAALRRELLAKAGVAALAKSAQADAERALDEFRSYETEYQRRGSALAYYHDALERRVQQQKYTEQSRLVHTMRQAVANATREHALAVDTHNMRVARREQARLALVTLEDEKKHLVQKAQERSCAEMSVAALLQRAHVLSCYRRIIKPPGARSVTGSIAEVLLADARAAIEFRANATLVELGTDIRVSIGAEYEITCTVENITLPHTLMSGYQTFVLSIAFRQALWHLAPGACPDLLIIDEGFGTCDEAHLSGIVSALENWMSRAVRGPRVLLVVSHLTELKTPIDRLLSIERRDGASTLSHQSPGEYVCHHPPTATRTKRARAY